MKQFCSIALVLLSLLLALSMLTACGDGNGNTDTTASVTTEDVGSPSAPEILITFNGTGYTASEAGGLSASGNVLTITKAGRYRLTGTLTNAQLRVDVAKTETVELVFDGINITNQSSAPIYVKSADKVKIELADGSENVLTDAKTYIFPEGGDKPNACLYSSEDITISGSGSLTINANYNNGIGSKNDIKIKSGKITVVAANNGIKGNQSVEIKGGTLNVSGMDGIKSDSLMENEGWVEIIGGNIEITCSDDGIQAVSHVLVKAEAKVTVTAADKDVNCDGETDIAEGALISK
jgi:hypothetical protein